MIAGNVPSALYLRRSPVSKLFYYCRDFNVSRPFRKDHQTNQFTNRISTNYKPSTYPVLTRLNNCKRTTALPEIEPAANRHLNILRRKHSTTFIP